MKITNIEEFEELLNFIFSDEYYNLQEVEKQNVKIGLKLAAEKIEKSCEKMEIVLKSEFEDDYDGEFVGNSNRIFFIMENLSEESKIKIIADYLNCNITEYVSYKGSQFEIFLRMLDFLTQEQKIKAFSKVNTKNLLELMSKFNAKSKSISILGKPYKYYNNLYDISRKALAMKELR